MTGAVRERRVRLRTGAVLVACVHEPVGENDRPPLVMIPGVNGAGELFSSFAPRLALSRTVITTDLGDRLDPGSSWIDSATGDVEELLRGIGSGLCDVLGQSFGSLVAVRLWRRALVRRLILAPPALAPRRGPLLLADWFAKAAAIRLWPLSRRRSLKNLLARTGGYSLEPDLGEEELGHLIQRARRIKAVPFLRRIAALRGHSWEREIDGVTAPTLVLEGDREMAMLPPTALDPFRRRENIRVVVVPGGHMPFLTHPEEFHREMIEFLDAGPVTG